jgi:hypothetical protein
MAPAPTSRISRKPSARDITPYPVSVSLADGGATITGALPQGVEKAGIVVVHFRPGQTRSRPRGGANKGKPMTYWNLVTKFESLGEWKAGPERYARSCDLPAASCMVQKEWHGRHGHRRGPEEVVLR